MRLVFNFLFIILTVFITAPIFGGGKKDRFTGSQDTLMFIGVSGRLSNREETIQAALEDAARRLSFFHSVSGSSIKREQIGGGVLDFNIDSDYQIDYDKDIVKYLDVLEYDPISDVFEYNNALFVTSRAALDITMPLSLGHSYKKEHPFWINEPPIEIDGFIVGIGSSSKLNSHSDTVIRSYEKAVIDIIENIGSFVSAEKISYQNSNSVFDFNLVSHGETSTYGTLSNFYIIESWTDPVNLSVWTLAVAKGRQTQ